MAGSTRFQRDSSSKQLALMVGAVVALAAAMICANLLLAAIQAPNNPEPTASPGASAGLATATPVATNTAMETAIDTATPSGSSQAWTSIDFKRVSSAPFGKATTSSPSVVAWKGGYVAVGYSRDVDGQAGTFGGWTSTDAMSWQPVPDGTFPADGFDGQAAPCGSGVVAIVNGSANALAYFSVDGSSWTRTQTLADSFTSYPPRLAGTDAGAAVVLGGMWGSTSLWFTSDCGTWTQVSLPKGPDASITPTGVTVMDGGFLAYGALSPKDSVAATTGAAWWSTDGKNWTAESLPASPSLIYGGSVGAAASLEAQFQPGVVTDRWASSPDGATWQMAPATTVFPPTLGQAASDGNRIVVMGSADGKPPFGLWSSTDGADWQSLTIAGDPGAADGVLGDTDFFVLPGGVLRVSEAGVWYGAAGTGPMAASPRVAPTPLPSLPGTFPPTTTATWTGLTVRPLSRGPVGATSFAAWPGGYLAMADADVSSATPVAWVSRDGESWTPLPSATFGNATRLTAASCRDQILVAAGDAAGNTSVWRSSDGLTWQPSAAPPVQMNTESIAGNAGGAIALTADARVAYTTDCSTWQIVDPAQGSGVELGPIAASATTYLVSGCAPMSDKTAAAPPAGTSWWSTDGQHWHAASGGDCLLNMAAGSQGFVAQTRPMATPGTVGFVGSADGKTWSNRDDPLGYWSGGEGDGTALGSLTGDGNRILAYGTTQQSQVPAYWTSLDGRHWTDLRLVGDAPALPHDVTPVLLRNGVLFIGTQGTWFGAATH